MFLRPVCMICLKQPLLRQRGVSERTCGISRLSCHNFSQRTYSMLLYVLLRIRVEAGIDHGSLKSAEALLRSSNHVIEIDMGCEGNHSHLSAQIYLSTCRSCMRCCCSGLMRTEVHDLGR